MVVELHPHQSLAVEKLSNGKILYGGVGVGKSITAMAYYVQKVCNGIFNEWESMKTPKDVYVITTAKKRDSYDWESEAIKFGVSPTRENSIDRTQIVVDSWNNIDKYTHIKDAFFIFDEQRVVGYGAWTKAFIKIARDNQWILLSATPGDTWLDYIPVFIANGFYKHKTEFVSEHVVWKPRVKYYAVDRYVNTGQLIKYRNQLLVHMPYERHTTRHAVDIWCDHDETAYNKVTRARWNVFENRPLRDAGETYAVARKVVNSDWSRIEAVGSLMTKHPRLIVFYNFDYELEMLRTLGEIEWQTTGTSTSTPDSSPKKASSTTPTLSTTPESSSSSGCPSPLPSSTTSSPRNGSTTSSASRLATGGQTSPSSTSQAPGPLTSVASGKVTPGSTPTTELKQSDETVSGLSSSSPTPSTPTSEPAGSPAANFAVAEWNGHKHEEVPTTARWLYLVQYRAGAEGWNCTTTDAMAFYSQTYSYRDWWQGHGRIDRLNTPFKDLWYYHLVSKTPVDKGIRASLRSKKSFNERDLVL